MFYDLKQQTRVAVLILFSVFMSWVLGGCNNKNNHFYKNNNHGEIEISLQSNSPGSSCKMPEFLYTDHLSTYHCTGENNYAGGSSGTDFEVAGYCVMDISDFTTQDLTNIQYYNYIIVDCASGSLTSLSADSFLAFNFSGTLPDFLADDDLSVTVTCLVQGERRAQKTIKYTQPVDSRAC